MASRAGVAGNLKAIRNPRGNATGNENEGQTEKPAVQAEGRVAESVQRWLDKLKTGEQEREKALQRIIGKALTRTAEGACAVLSSRRLFLP